MAALATQDRLDFLCGSPGMGGFLGESSFSSTVLFEEKNISFCICLNAVSGYNISSALIFNQSECRVSPEE